MVKISIKENLDSINLKIEDIVSKQGRKLEDITLIAVSKTIEIDRINEAISLGATELGENKVQEIESKFGNLIGSPNIHMIGHLQTNKVKYIIDKVKLIHSLDRMSLAEEIEKRAKNKNLTIDTLVQVNVAEEESKFGMKLEEVKDFLKELEKFENLRVKGLMTIAPFDEDKEKVRYVFKELKNLFEDIKSQEFKNVEMKYLSMGMTNDYEVALEEGSNMVRIGTGIFGKRDYSK